MILVLPPHIHGCRACVASITPALVGAASSVGIEHGRSTNEELVLYLNANHRHH